MDVTVPSPMPGPQGVLNNYQPLPFRQLTGFVKRIRKFSNQKIRIRGLPLGTSPSQMAGLHPEPCHHLLQDESVWVMSPLSPEQQADWYTILQSPLQKNQCKHIMLAPRGKAIFHCFPGCETRGILPAVNHFFFPMGISPRMFPPFLTKIFYLFI